MRLATFLAVADNRQPRRDGMSRIEAAHTGIMSGEITVTPDGDAGDTYIVHSVDRPTGYIVRLSGTPTCGCKDAEYWGSEALGRCCKHTLAALMYEDAHS